LIRRVDGNRVETKNQHAIFDSYADWHAGCSIGYPISQLWLIPEKSGVFPVFSRRICSHVNRNQRTVVAK
jgi:hypothetical protein